MPSAQPIPDREPEQDEQAPLPSAPQLAAVGRGQEPVTADSGPESHGEATRLHDCTDPARTAGPEDGASPAGSDNEAAPGDGAASDRETGSDDAGSGDEPAPDGGAGSEEPASAANESPAVHPSAQPSLAERNLALGAVTAAGLSTMTPLASVTAAPERRLGEVVLEANGLGKRFGREEAVRELALQVRRGSFFGIVGPNGAGKTTTLSMITGLLRPSTGSVQVLGVDVWANPDAARARIGILPDRLRLFDQLSGAQLLYYVGVLRGLPPAQARERAASLLETFELEHAGARLVADYSAGMAKKIGLASALIHAPELLVLDEPFESIDPVTASQLTEVLFDYVARGGTVVLSSHSMDLVQRACDHVAIIVEGRVLVQGTVAAVRGEVTLEERFRDLVRAGERTEGLDWLGISFD